MYDLCTVQQTSRGTSGQPTTCASIVLKYLSVQLVAMTSFRIQQKNSMGRQRRTRTCCDLVSLNEEFQWLNSQAHMIFIDLK